MTKPSINLQDLRRRIYSKAKSEPEWRFWGLYVHICKLETLEKAYKMAKENNGAPGVDGVTFEDIETLGRQQFLQEIQRELQANNLHAFQEQDSRDTQGERWGQDTGNSCYP